MGVKGDSGSPHRARSAIIGVVVVGTALTIAVLLVREPGRGGGATASDGVLGRATLAADSEPYVPAVSSNSSDGATPLVSPTPPQTSPDVAEQAAHSERDFTAPAQVAWDGLYAAADGLTFGTMTEDELIGLTLDLLDQLDLADGPRETGSGLLAYDLLSDPGLGEATLYVRVDPELREQQHDFSIEAKLNVRGGAYTNDPSGEPTVSNVELSFSMDDQQRPTHLAGLSQNVVHHTPEFWSFMTAAEKPVAVGGSYNISAQSATWSQITVEAGGTSEFPSFTSTISVPIAKPGSLANPLLEVLSSRFLEAKNASPK